MSPESEAANAPINFDDLFNGETIVDLDFKGQKLKIHFREMSLEVDRDYQRRSSKTKSINGRVEAADDALTVDLWLFDQLATSCEIMVGDRGRGVEDFKTRLSTGVKRAALYGYRQRCRCEILD